MATKIDTRVGCSPNKVAERVPEEFPNDLGTAVNTPAVNNAIGGGMPEFGSVNDIASHVGISASGARRLIVCGSLATVKIDLAKGRYKYNVTSAQHVVDQHKVEAQARLHEGQQLGRRSWSRSTLVNGSSLSK